MTYTAKTFTIPTLVGISAQSVEEHIKLYQGYVKHFNLINETIKTLEVSGEDHTYQISELTRRVSFEYNGIKNHEYYFESIEGGAQEINTQSALYAKITSTWGSFKNWLDHFKKVALTRGIGWAMLSYDKHTDTLINHWVDEQHLGQLLGTTPILCLDMWEHSYVADYYPSGKKQYVEDFFKNLNWSVIEKNM